MHKAFGNITGIKGFLELIKTADDTQKQKYGEKVIISIESLESHMRELDLLAKDIEAENSHFNLYSVIERKLSKEEKMLFDNDMKMITDKKWFDFISDFELSELAIDLICRILQANIIPHSEIQANIKGPELVFARTPFKNRYFSAIDGPWGYEKELLNSILQALNWKITYGLSEHKEYIHINPFRRYDEEL
ncbi:MAG: hypothetical protein ACLFSQ_00860 [Candidatus Zixiibacteriota bacterium]